MSKSDTTSDRCTGDDERMAPAVTNIGERVLWPGMSALKGFVIAIDYLPDEPIAWLRRQDEIGDFHYHAAKLKELRNG